MDKFETLTAIAAPMPLINIDTDMIIPKQFLKTIKRSGLGVSAFFEMRYDLDGNENPDFVLNKPAYRSAEILVAGDNFGTGSSREHAPWALLDQGITCVIAPSFADIFYNNCGKNGILAIALPIDVCNALAAQAGGSNSVFEIDLEAKTVTTPDGEQHSFDFDEGRREKLLKGLDDIALSLLAEDAISAFETQRKLATPWLETA